MLTGHRLRMYRRALGPAYRVPPDDDGGGNGGGGGKQEKPVSEVVSSLIRKHGSAETALGILAGENRDYRKRHRADQERITELTPQKGGLVLTPEQAKDFEAFKALGKPDEVKARLDKEATMAPELESLKHREFMREVGREVGYNPTVLGDRVTADGLHVEMRDEQVSDGKGGTKPAKVPYVRKAADANAQLEPLTAYAAKNWGDYLPSLKVEATKGNTGNATTGGVRLPSSAPALKDGTGGGGLLKQQMDKRAALADKPNPLKPPVTATSV